MSKNQSVEERKASSSSLTIKQHAGDAANRWLDRNRNLVLRQTPIWAQSLAVMLLALSSIAVAAGFLFKIDEVVTVKGQLQSIGGTVQVKTPAGGLVDEVLFKDGDLVQKGQLLVKFDTREAADSKDTLTRLIALERRELESRMKTIASQKKTLKGRADVLRQKLRTKIVMTDEIKKLVDNGGFQRLQYLQQLDEVFEFRKQLNEVEEQDGQLQLAIDQMRLETSKNIDQMKSDLKRAELQLQYQNVIAPVTGIVFNPQASPKGVIGAGERILSLVPQAGLFAEVFVPNRDIGFVQTGQEAKIRVDAFPFTRYGEILGEVTQIGADALPPDSTKEFYRFSVKLELDKTYLENKGAKIPLQSGMAITSNLKLREKRVISLLSDLLVDQTDSVKSIRQQ